MHWKYLGTMVRNSPGEDPLLFSFQYLTPIRLFASDLPQRPEYLTSMYRANSHYERCGDFTIVVVLEEVRTLRTAVAPLDPHRYHGAHKPHPRLEEYTKPRIQ